MPTAAEEITIATMDPHVEFEGFQGTLDELICEVRRFVVDILKTPLADVTTQCRNEALAAEEPDFEPFMKISGLMFVKSRTLLPTEALSMEDELLEEDMAISEEEEPTRVRERLEEQYRFFKEVGEVFREMRDERALNLHFSMTRGDARRLLDEVEYLESVTSYDLLMTYVQVLKRALEDTSYHISTSEAQTLARRIAEVFDYIFQREENVAFSAMVQNRAEAALTFLAVVFLVSQGKVSAIQKKPFSEIYLKARHAEEG
ncbi:MAG: ScpA family protein [bacterium]